jgi:uncharacterized membrane protein
VEGCGTRAQWARAAIRKSLQIGRPVSEVFRAWSNLDELPKYVHLVEDVWREGDRSHWILNLGGKKVEWEAEITQFLPDQAIGWKSVSGPKHTGRIDFSPLGNDTLIHITMNYAPPMQAAHLFAPITNQVEDHIEQAFRDFKAALEGKGQEGRTSFAQNERRATGTYGGNSNAGSSASGLTGSGGSIGPSAVSAGETPTTQTGRFGNPETSVEYTRPPEKKYP